MVVAAAMTGMLFSQAAPVWADGAMLAQAPPASDKAGSAAKQMPAKGMAGVTQVRGTIAAIDKEKSTVTLKGPKGRTITLEVRDKTKFDVIKVGDPVVASYMEAVVIEAKKAGTATPGVTTQETRVSSKPGETPAGAIGREVTITGTITAIDQKAKTVTVKGPQGGTESLTVKDPKALEAVKVGDMVELTYAQALAVSLDKPAGKSK
jgi:hypothetical protein